ncbi:MAG TPA: type II toxin-antitoxin system prevent-host-death family antitoxin [Rhodopila sp.]|nr:type II toxin-antitoxin system prevent-host-death family antitoxin [Rhodopila sp.]
MQVTIPEARNRLPQLIKSVHAGAEVVIAEGGEPVTRLVPVVCAPATTIDTGRASAILDWLARHPLPENLQRSPEEIDATIQAERDFWD